MDARAPSIDGTVKGVAADATKERRVAMLLWGPCAPDARVEKEARALVGAGYRVRIYCTARADLPDHEVKQGVEYIRLPLIFPWPIRLLRWIARRIRPSR